VTAGDFLHTKNTYYSGVAGLMGGAIGGKAWHSALISATIATLDVACFPHERPAHITGGKWFLGNLLSSTAAGLVAYGIGHGARAIFKDKSKPENFAEREDERRLTCCDAPEKTR
jgi:hypothetical protein